MSDASSRRLDDEALAAIQARVGRFTPEVAIICGSGLGDAAAAVKVEVAIPYGDIPGMPKPKVVGHAGKALFGTWGGRRVVVFQGRVHYYEGHPWNRVTLPVRLASKLGARLGVFTNSSGAINRMLRPGSIVILSDHINLIGSSALVGETADNPTTMFTDMTDAYSPRCRALLKRAGALAGLELFEGVYVGVSGPNYETPAEIRAFGVLGGDVIGMSTVGEVLVGRHLGMECCGISFVSNLAAGLGGAISHEEVLAAGKASAGNLAKLLEHFLPTAL
jgi:inosine/guanosine/xanthosine phosphorylase family protein